MSDSTTAFTQRSPLQLRYLFLVVLGVGSLGILAGWAVSEWISSAPWIGVVLTIVLPLGGMAAYVVLGLLDSPANRNDVAFADSVYYLGFLFTLVAMAVSLSAFDADESVGLVARFALALTTTIVGLAFRVFLVNFRATMAESRARAEAELADAVTRFRSQLDQISLGMVAQDKAAKESLANAIENTETELAGAVEEARSLLTGAISELQSAMKQAATELQTQVKNGSAGLQEQLDSLLEGIKKVSGELDEIVENISLPKKLFVEALQPPLSQLRGQLSRQATSLEKLGDRWDDITKTAGVLKDGVEQVEDKIKGLAKAAGTLTENLSPIRDLKSDSEQLAAALEGATGALQNLGEALRREAEEIAGISGTVGSDVELARQQKEKLHEEVKKAEDAVTLMHQQLTTAARYILKELKR